MKIAVATKDWTTIAGHAGQARRWLVYDLSSLAPDGPPPEPARVELAKEQVFHHFEDDAPHPLDGVGLMIVGSAGEGFVRHMRKRGAEVAMTGEGDPVEALRRLAAGEDLPDRRFDITTSLCRLRDLFSRH